MLQAIDHLIKNIENSKDPIGLSNLLIEAKQEADITSLVRLRRCHSRISDQPDDPDNFGLLQDIVIYNLNAMERVLIQQETECRLTGLCYSRPANELAFSFLELDLKGAAIEREHPTFTFA